MAVRGVLVLALASSARSLTPTAAQLRRGARRLARGLAANKPKQPLGVLGEGGLFDLLRAGLKGQKPASAGTGATNEVVSVVDGVRQKRLGNSGLVVRRRAPSLLLRTRCCSVFFCFVCFYSTNKFKP